MERPRTHVPFHDPQISKDCTHRPDTCSRRPTSLNLPQTNAKNTDNMSFDQPTLRIPAGLAPQKADMYGDSANNPPPPHHQAQTSGAHSNMH